MGQNLLSRAVTTLAENPRVFCKGVYNRWRARRGLPGDGSEFTLNGIRVRVQPEFASYQNNLFYGARDVAMRDFMEHYLRPGDIFVDVGANIGRVTAVALGLVGPRGQVHCFEPIPRYARVLEGLAADNPEYQLFINQVALGAQSGTSKLYLSDETNIGHNTLVPDVLDPTHQQTPIEVRLMRLDDYLEVRTTEAVRIIKIDVDGYEYPVLRGLERYFQSRRPLPALICEVFLPAYQVLGLSLRDLELYLRGFGYEARRLINPRKSLSLTGMEQSTDVLFLPQDFTL